MLAGGQHQQRVHLEAQVDIVAARGNGPASKVSRPSHPTVTREKKLMLAIRSRLPSPYLPSSLSMLSRPFL